MQMQKSEVQKTHPYQAVFGPLKPGEGTTGREKLKLLFFQELGMGLEAVIFGS